MEGWMDGEKNCLFIFIIFNYYKKKDVLFSKMLSKIDNNHSMGLKIWFEAEGGGTRFLKLPYLRKISNIWFHT